MPVLRKKTESYETKEVYEIMLTCPRWKSGVRIQRIQIANAEGNQIDEQKQEKTNLPMSARKGWKSNRKKVVHTDRKRGNYRWLMGGVVCRCIVLVRPDMLQEDFKIITYTKMDVSTLFMVLQRRKTLQPVDCFMHIMMMKKPASKVLKVVIVISMILT